MTPPTTVSWRGDAFLKRVREAVDAGLLTAAAVVSREMKTNMGSESGGVSIGGKTIRNYQGRKIGESRTRKRQRYVSSRPGDFPGVRLGHLRNSITFTLARPGYALAGTNVKYGRYLEFGTSKMAARPWALRSAIMAQPEATRRFATTFRKHMGLGG